MADPVAPAAAAAVAPEEPRSREVRVFLSSTFRDFNEERQLLATQVFPRLNRQARERGVELVEVDLRWGVTQEQAEDGHALEICLKEIERCKPYFIGMLGDSYGSLTPPQRQLLEAAPELLEQRPWLDGRIGEASYTELEIEHCLQLLRDPAMAGRAFFYFRDPAYSDSKADAGESGWRSATTEDRQKLELLRQKIRSSGCPLTEALKDPQAIVDQIEKDLWALIDQQFPAEEQPDALEKEARKHADYRRSRTGAGQYVGGEAYIQQLEQWLAEGQQQILITGESGAGKSALIANWMEAHQQAYPEDVVYAHHLGCTNDANALRPMLGRLIDTASAQLLEAGLITQALAVPEDWWDLVARMAEALQSLGRLAERNNHRWIWVLDGLDRLNPDDQNALPWLPQNLPTGVQMVASALACPARAILSERGYTTLTIGPLAAAEQELLIQRYLQRYTKELDGGLRQQILNHPLAGSPLFLKMLLEELRQCGRHDTLKSQLEFYLSSQTIDDLYERILERLENDGSGDNVRKVMTVLWASRAGLSETELLAITGLAPLQWAPIDLALEKAFGRNGNRLVFDHDFLRTAVKDRYLPTEEARRQAHSDLADWYEAKEGWDERDSEEIPWQLQEAVRLKDLRHWLLVPGTLANLQWDRGSREVINYWLTARRDGDGELDELIAEALDEEIEIRRNDTENLIWLVDRIAALLDEAGLYRKPLLRLSSLSLELKEAADNRSEESILSGLLWLANAHFSLGDYGAALPLCQRCLKVRERLLGLEHPDTLITVGNLAELYRSTGEYEQAEAFYTRALKVRERLLGPEHPNTLTTISNLAGLYQDKGDYEQAEAFYTRALEARERLLGLGHPDTLTTVSNLAGLYRRKGDYEQAEAFYTRALKARERLLGPEHPDTLNSFNSLACLFRDRGDCKQAEAFCIRALEARERLLGPEHPDTLTTVSNLAGLYQDKGDYEQAEAFYTRALEARERLLGPEHPDTLNIISNLGVLYADKGDYEQAEAFYTRALEARERLLGPEHPDTLTTVSNLAGLYRSKGDYKQAEAFCTRALEARERLLGPEHPDTLNTIANLGVLYADKGDYEQAEAFYTRALKDYERLLGPEHPDMLNTIANLGVRYADKGDYEQAEAFYTRALKARERLLGPEHPDTLTTVSNLAGLYQDKGDYEQAEAFYTRALKARERLLGPEHPSMLTTVSNLAGLYQDKGDYEQAEAFYTRALEARERLLGPEHPDTLNIIANLGVLYADKGDYEQAEAFYTRALEARERLLGPEHPDTLTTVSNLAGLYRSKGDYKQAEAFYTRALEARERLLGPEHPDTLTTVSNLAGLYRSKGDYKQAEAFYTRALEARERLLGPEHPDTLTTAYNLADLLSKLERRAEAIPLRRRELAWCCEQNGDTDPATLTSINELAIDLRETGELEEAEALFRELVAGRQQVLEPDDFQIGRALGGLAMTLELAGKLEEALDYSQQTLAHRLAHAGPHAWLTNRERVDLARILHKLGRDLEATALLQELQMSMARIEAPDDDDRQLMSDAADLQRTIDASS